MKCNNLGYVEKESTSMGITSIWNVPFENHVYNLIFWKKKVSCKYIIFKLANK